jgi:hypothetical protein
VAFTGSDANGNAFIGEGNHWLGLQAGELGNPLSQSPAWRLREATRSSAIKPPLFTLSALLSHLSPSPAPSRSPPSASPRWPSGACDAARRPCRRKGDFGVTYT